MSKTGKKNKSNQSDTSVYKQDEFDIFISTIKGNAVGSWVQIANVVGVSRDTINRWRKLPQARKAITDAIERANDEMERSGKDDWRMWESKLKMLGVSPIERKDLTSDDKPINLGVISYDKLDDE